MHQDYKDRMKNEAGFNQSRFQASWRIVDSSEKNPNLERRIILAKGHEFSLELIKSEILGRPPGGHIYHAIQNIECN